MNERKINPDFNIPYYIFEEIVDYIEHSTAHKNQSVKWDNIVSLLGCAIINERLTPEQANSLIQIYCRENKEDKETT